MLSLEVTKDLGAQVLNVFGSLIVNFPSNGQGKKHRTFVDQIS